MVARFTSAPMCSAGGCEDVAHWMPVLFLYRHTKTASPDKGEMRIPLCHEHMMECTKESLVNDEVWGEMLSIFCDSGKWLPDRDLVEVRFLNLTNGTLVEGTH